MAIREIVKIPNKILNTRLEEVVEITPEISEMVKDLKDTLSNSKVPGAGLAANQIGINKRICIVRDFYPNPEKDNEEIYKEYVLINPKITVSSKKEGLDWEGCLSIPDTYGLVKRLKKIKVEALDENGKKIKFTAEGFFARTILHEVDHLNGILFTSKVVGKTKTEKELDKLYSNNKQLG
jgi:peptide deformylase